MKGINMFKGKKTPPPAKVGAAAPQKTAVEIEAEKTIARGMRIKSLAESAAMWRKFALGCEPGRYVAGQSSYGSLIQPMMEVGRLTHYMDEDSAPLWKAFAHQMAGHCERRMRDILGV